MSGKTNNHQQIIKFPGTGDEIPNLTRKQQSFVNVYAGHIRESAKEAGISYAYGRELILKAHIVAAIRLREKKEVRPDMILNRLERQAFWSTVVRDQYQDMRDRLRASELLARSEADFLPREDEEDQPDPMEALRQYLDGRSRGVPSGRPGTVQDTCYDATAGEETA